MYHLESHFVVQQATTKMMTSSFLDAGFFGFEDFAMVVDTNYISFPLHSLEKWPIQILSVQQHLYFCVLFIYFCL